MLSMASKLLVRGVLGTHAYLGKIGQLSLLAWVWDTMDWASDFKGCVFGILFGYSARWVKG